MLDGIPVRLRFHATVCECANNFDRDAPPRRAKRPRLDSGAIRNDHPIASEMSNEVVFGAGASRAFHSAHHFAINNSALNDVQGNYVSDRFVASVYHHH